MIRPQYHFRQDQGRTLVWDVQKLVAGLKGAPVHQVPLSDIAEIDEAYWYDLGGARPTCRSVLSHARLIGAADLDWPIILCPQGRVMDGMHRVLKALDLGHSHIAAYRLDTMPDPDAIDPAPGDLRD